MTRILAIFLLLSACFLGLGYVRSESGLIHTFDTGLYLQLLSNLLAGRGWMSSIVQESTFLAHHFQPLVLLLVPFHLITESAWMLLLVGWLAGSLAGFYLIWQLPQRGLCSASTACIAALAMFLHPTLSSRMYYSFVPEVLVLPVLAWLACELASARTIPLRESWRVLLALFFVGLGKENYWITSAWIALLFACQEKSKTGRAWFAGWSLGFLLLMFLLFFKWMPEHSSMQQYYGLTYFENAWVDQRWGMFGRILGAGLNIFSVRSLTLGALVLFLLPCGLIFLGNVWTTAAALPTLALVMAASNDQIHDITNHYLLACLPFLAVSIATGLERAYAKLKAPRLGFYCGLLVVLIPAGSTLMHHAGWLFQAMFASERVEWRLRDEAKKLRATLHPGELVLMDGSLQPLFPDLPRVRIIQGFQGHPSPLSPADRAAAQHIITANDLRGLENCDAAQTDSQDLVRYDLENFLSYCRWLKTQDLERVEYLPERLIHLKIKKSTDEKPPG